MTRDEIAGSWKIVSWEQSYDDGRLTFPMGEHLNGRIEYAERHVFVMIARADRPSFSTGGQWTASNEEKAQAYNSCLCYSGTYEIVGDTVIHHVDISLFPNWVGAQQRRQASIVDGRLVLAARLEDGTAEARTARLVWERARA